ncbi:MAG: putative secreted protein [Circoviridae sp.]|nr:MAG: putative secreted protein [Circoviridae sp.]
MMKTSRKAVIAAVDEIVGDSYNVRKGVQGAGKIRTGGRTIARGLTIAATLAAMDGPLPFGDVLAAGFLIGGGAYITYTGVKDVIQ